MDVSQAGSLNRVWFTLSPNLKFESLENGALVEAGLAAVEHLSAVAVL